MHIISKQKLKQFWEIYPNAESNLQHWFTIENKAELFQILPTAFLKSSKT